MTRLNHITLVQNTTTDPDDRCTRKVLDFMAGQNIRVSLLKVAGKECPEVPSEAENPDLVLVVGGDGTFLRAARKFVHNRVPLAGINTGTLGFLTHIDPERLEEFLTLLVGGQYTLEERIMLSIRHPRQDSECGEELALNDVVIKNANPSQLCTLRLFVNDTLVAIYDSDGLILSTPTGTTAYTMAAGGPVISPEVEAICITPICPHSFSAKAAVVPANKEFRVESDSKNYDVVYALDGLECGTLKPGESLQVFRSNLSFRMVNFLNSDDDFYVLLKRKLHWSMNPRWQAMSDRPEGGRRYMPADPGGHS